MSIYNVIHRGVEIPLLCDIMETKHRELADLEDLLRLPGIEDVLSVMGLSINVSLIYYVMLQQTAQT